MDTLLFGVDGASRDNSTGMLPTLPVPVNYPMSAAFTLMPLQGPDYNASVLTFVCLSPCLPACLSACLCVSMRGAWLLVMSAHVCTLNMTIWHVEHSAQVSMPSTNSGCSEACLSVRNLFETVYQCVHLSVCPSAYVCDGTRRHL